MPDTRHADARRIIFGYQMPDTQMPDVRFDARYQTRRSQTCFLEMPDTRHADARRIIFGYQMPDTQKPDKHIN